MKAYYKDSARKNKIVTTKDGKVKIAVNIMRFEAIDEDCDINFGEFSPGGVDEGSIFYIRRTNE